MSEAPDDLLRRVRDGVLRHDDGSTDIDSSVSAWLDDAQTHFRAALARAAVATPMASTASRSLLAAIVAARVRRRALAQSSDTALLVLAARGGSLLDKRTALQRLAHLASDDASLADDVDFASFIQEPELERDLQLLLEHRRGSAGRAARAELTDVRSGLARLSRAIARVLDGSEASDPYQGLRLAERTRLSLYLRDADDGTVAFLLDRIADLRDQADGPDVAERIALLRSAADVRTLPLLATVLLDDLRSEVRTEAIRALSRIDDRRVVGLLLSADGRASDSAERLAIAEGLALWGDFRGSDCIREALADAREATRLAALEALWDPALAEQAFAHFAEGELELRRAALRALTRTGHERALAWLDEREPDPALTAEFEVARDAILARLELRGDTEDELRAHRARKPVPRVLVRAPGVEPTKRHRFLGLMLVLRAILTRLLGLREASSSALDRASDADPSWPLPGLMQGNLWLDGGNLSRAVAGYRRALASCNDGLLRNGHAMTRIARAYLERTDELLEEGRTEAARALIDELMLNNLSRVASHVRHAARRRRRKLSHALPAAEASR
ncbi:MAG: hypothetical protein R3B13_24755 [Polyangiaceae bacterium]